MTVYCHVFPHNSISIVCLSNRHCTRVRRSLLDFTALTTLISSTNHKIIPRSTPRTPTYSIPVRSKTLHVPHPQKKRKCIPIYIQQDATLHSLFYLKTALHVSGGTSTHHQELIQLYLQHLVLVTPLLLPAAIAARSSNGVTNIRCCRYSCMCS